MEYQKIYNSLLKKSLEHQKDQIDLLKLTVDQNMIHIDSGSNYWENKNTDYEKKSDDISNTSDNDLIEWLRSINIDDQSIKKV